MLFPTSQSVNFSTLSVKNKNPVQMNKKAVPQNGLTCVLAIVLESITATTLVVAVFIDGPTEQAFFRNPRQRDTPLDSWLLAIFPPATGHYCVTDEKHYSPRITQVVALSRMEHPASATLAPARAWDSVSVSRFLFPARQHHHVVSLTLTACKLV